MYIAIEAPHRGFRMERGSYFFAWFLTFGITRTAMQGEAAPEVFIGLNVLALCIYLLMAIARLRDIGWNSFWSVFFWVPFTMLYWGFFPSDYAYFDGESKRQFRANAGRATLWVIAGWGALGLLAVILYGDPL